MTHAELAATVARRLRWETDDDRQRYEAALLRALDDRTHNRCGCNGPSHLAPLES